MNESKQKIIQVSYQLFHRLGMRSITMDDIAREVGMSKKTLYQHFTDKDEIVKESIQAHINIIQKTIIEVKNQSKDAIQEIMMTSERMGEFIRGMNPAAFYDMKKYYPAAMQIFEEHQQKFFYQVLETNIKWGITEGLYRKDIDIEITAYKRLHEVESACSPEVFPIKKFNIETIQKCLLDQFMHSICTLKGHKLINKYKNIEEN
jgi:AcrR family transcriptional regulator